MVSSHFMEPLAKGYLLMANILSTVRIDKLSVPEVIESDCTTAALECLYSGAGDDVTVRWLLNGSQVYEWSQGKEPSASGLLEERVDLSYRNSALQVVQKHTLRILALTPELSGDYTCAVQSRGQEASRTKTMIVFSPEQEFELTVSQVAAGPGAALGPGVALAVSCVAKHLHPQPDLTIEYKKVPISQQQQHIWRLGAYYDAECTAVLPVPRAHGGAGAGGEVACRLRIPQVDYTAITTKNIYVGMLRGILDHSGGTLVRLHFYLVTLCIVVVTYKQN